LLFWQDPTTLELQSAPQQDIYQRDEWGGLHAI
jgi:hypothetical protein